MCGVLWVQELLAEELHLQWGSSLVFLDFLLWTSRNFYLCFLFAILLHQVISTLLWLSFLPFFSLFLILLCQFFALLCSSLLFSAFFFLAILRELGVWVVWVCVWFVCLFSYFFLIKNFGFVKNKQKTFNLLWWTFLPAAAETGVPPACWAAWLRLSCSPESRTFMIEFLLLTGSREKEAKFHQTIQ